MRAAYAEFIAAYSRFLSLGGVWYSALRQLEDLKNHVYDELGHANVDELKARLIELSRQTKDAIVPASNEARKTAVAVVLLEGDAELSQRMREFLCDELLPPQGAHEYDRFSADLKSGRDRLDVFTLALAGKFAPKPQPSTVEIRALANKDKKALKSGG